MEVKSSGWLGICFGGELKGHLVTSDVRIKKRKGHKVILGFYF
jgi:hypothetical protein